jgi:hypothetical protein
MPAEIDARAVTRLLPEMAKKPSEFFVNVKLQGTMVPDASYTVNAPMTVLAGTLVLIVKLLMLTVIELTDHDK